MTDRADGGSSSSADGVPGGAVTAVAEDRDPALVLAGLHLRLGSLALARAELETLAAEGGLDHAGRVDLAEVRWRTGDLIGAGEMARQTLASGDESVIALVVAAEAAAAMGRPTESRKLATQAQAQMGGPIDPIFAGMPRSGVWPADPAEPVPSPTTLFPPDRATPGNGLAAEAAGRAEAASRSGSSARRGGDVDAAAGGAAPAQRDESGAPIDASAMAAGAGMSAAGSSAAAAAAAAAALAEHHGPGFWDDLDDAEPAAAAAAAPAPDIALPREPSPPEGLEPAAILDAGEAALVAGDYASAALHLGLVVRVAPSIAPAVLAAIGETPDAGLQMVRGDAYRVLGREVDARRAYELAMTSAAQAEGPSAAAPNGASGRPGGPALGSTIPIDRWDPASWEPAPAPSQPPLTAGEGDDDVEPPPFLVSRPWPGMVGDRPGAGEAAHHESGASGESGARDESGDPTSHDLDPVPDDLDPDDDSDPFAGEP
jgi:hypothetical protein